MINHTWSIRNAEFTIDSVGRPETITSIAWRLTSTLGDLSYETVGSNFLTLDSFGQSDLTVDSATEAYTLSYVQTLNPSVESAQESLINSVGAPSTGSGLPWESQNDTVWVAGISYEVNDLVNFAGQTFYCIQAHTSENGYTPGTLRDYWRLLVVSPAVALESDGELVNGFFVSQYDSYFGDAVGVNDSNYQSLWTSDSESPTSTFSATTVNNTSNQAKLSQEYTGYYKAAYTGDHTFYLSTDDFGYMWVGLSANVESDMANAQISNPGTHSAEERSVTIAMDSGEFYPIRIRYGNVSSGPATLVASYEHSGQSKTNDWTGKVFHNIDSSNGGY